MVVVAHLTPFVFKSVGLYGTNPGSFYAHVCDVSLMFGWLIFWLISSLISWAYVRYLQISKIRNTLLNGLIWGVVFFIVSELIVAVLRAIYNLEKDPDIVFKTLSLFISCLISGLIISYGTYFLNRSKS